MDERGSAPLEFAAGVLLLLIPVVLLMVSFAPALERRVLARSLAADIGRSVALAGGTFSDTDLAGWSQRVRESGAGSHQVVVGLCGGPMLPIERLASCSNPSVVDVVVRVAVGGVVGEVQHHHRQPVPRFRSVP